MISKIRKADAAENILKAADLLKKGGIIIHPTETLYGFAANALLADAVRRVDAIKSRRRKATYIVLVKDAAMARQNYLEFDCTAEKLARRFWPGPLTLVLPIGKESPLIRLAARGTLAVRVSSDKFVQHLFRHIGFPIISTSVNRSGRPPLTRPEKMENQFGRKVGLILERGICASSVPSTIIAVRDNIITLIRKGAVTEEDIHGI
jgi:L-threonylcarbamoyladenylate synthase